MSLGFLVYFMPAAAFRRAAGKRLDARFPGGSADVWRSVRLWQSRLAQNRPRHSASVDLMIRHMEWSCALYHAVMDHGMRREEAQRLVETIGMDVYQPVPDALFRFSRLRSGNRQTRIKWLFGFITRYFFSTPFVHRHLPSDTGVAFDVTNCPFADYFKDQGVPELTPFAACNLDFALARACGMDLVRTQTIAKGAKHCDFRWQFKKQRAD